MVQRAVTLPNGIGSANGGGHVIFRPGHGDRYLQPVGQPGGYGRSESATGSMGVGRRDALCGEDLEIVAVVQDVGGRPFPVPPFNHHRPGSHGDDPRRSLPHIVIGSDVQTRQIFRLGDVGRDHRRQRNQGIADEMDSFLSEQSVSALGNHYWINHQVSDPVAPDCCGHRFHDLAGRQHAGFDRVGSDIGDNGVDLRGDDVSRNLMNRADPHGVLRGNRREGRGAKDTESGKGFEVRLDARSSTRVGAGDGHHGGWTRIGHTNSRHRFCSRLVGFVGQPPGIVVFLATLVRSVRDSEGDRHVPQDADVFFV